MVTTCHTLVACQIQISQHILLLHHTRTWVMLQHQYDRRMLFKCNNPTGACLSRMLHIPNQTVRFSNILYSNVHDNARNYEDAIDASRGMIAMSQTTSRNMYAPSMGRSRGSAESYGYPATHSNSSSISSASAYPVYLGGSIDSSISDYSSNGSEIDSVSSRTLPAPTGLVNGMPPAPSSMMSQFSSKMSSSTVKKHKCKICDKRFTRPSSLQTHMYSHTGEKRKHSCILFLQLQLLTSYQHSPVRSLAAVVISQ